MKNPYVINSKNVVVALALTFLSPNIKAQFSTTWLGNVPNWNPGGSGNSEPALQDPTPWSLGGNAIYGMPGSWFGSINNLPNPLFKTASIGTVDDAVFSMKAGNNEAIFINPNGSVRLGLNNTGSGSAAVNIWSALNPPLNQSRLSFFADKLGNIESSESMSLLFLSGQSFNVNEGSVIGGSVARITIDNNGKCGINNASPQAALDIKSNTSPGSFRIYGDNAGNVHSITDMKLNYGNTPGATEFQINSGDPSNATTRVLLNTFGTHINTGGSFNGMFIGPAASAWYNNCANHRLWMDAVANNGLAIVGGNGNEAVNVFNAAGALRFGMKINSGGGDDTKFKLSGSTQFGFYNSTSAFEDVNARVNVDAFGTTGVKVITNNFAKKALYVENTSLTQAIAFEVMGDGKTHIGSWRPNANGPCANAMLTVDGQILAKDIRVAISQGNGTSQR